MTPDPEQEAHQHSVEALPEKGWGMHRGAADLHARPGS